MAKNRNPNPETRNWGNRRDAEARRQMFSHGLADETRIFTIKSPPHKPSPHPDPLPSHPMGAEREQQADTNCLIKARRPESGSGVQCANFSGNSHPDPLPSHPMGAEREQQADANCIVETCKHTPGSGMQCANFSGEFSPRLSPRWAGRESAAIPALRIPQSSCGLCPRQMAFKNIKITKQTHF
jgi:hypothetical protein